MLVYFGSRRERESWHWAWIISTRLARQIGYLELLLKLMFVNPPELPEQTTRALPVRWHWYTDAYVIKWLSSLNCNVFGWLGGWFLFLVCRTGSCSRIIIVCPVLEGRPPWLKWLPHFQMPVKENLALWLPGSSEFSKTMSSKVGPLTLALPRHDFYHDLIRCWLTSEKKRSASILKLWLIRQEVEENMLCSILHSVCFDAGMPDHRLGFIGHL